jgi:hypothetical protein
VKLADHLAILDQHGTLKVIEEDVVAEDFADFHGLEEQSLLDVLVFSVPRQDLQTPVTETMSRKGRRATISQSSSLVDRTAWAAWLDVNESLLIAAPNSR